MFGFLRGNLLERDGVDSIILDVNGVGYLLKVTPTTSARLGDIGDQCGLYVHTRVREDDITLYAFLNVEDKRVFEAVLRAHGVGPSLAMSLLSMYGPSELYEIVASGDSAALALVPGIGKRTAAKLLVDLQSKFENLDVFGNGYAGVVDVENGSFSHRTELSAALKELGYDSVEIRSVMKRLPKSGSTEDLLKAALRELAVS